MKKIFVLVCALSLFFAGTAFTEPIEFPNGLTIDIAPGWSYEGEGDSIALTAEDKTCAVYITVTDAGDVSGKDTAIAMSKEHDGSKPQQLDEDTYFYVFENERGNNTRVYVGVEDGKLKILSITGDHKDVDEMISTITEKFQ